MEDGVGERGGGRERGGDGWSSFPSRPPSSLHTPPPDSSHPPSPPLSPSTPPPQSVTPPARSSSPLLPASPSVPPPSPTADLFFPSPAAGVADSSAASQKGYEQKREENEKKNALSPLSARMHDHSTGPVPILFFTPLVYSD